MDNTIDILVINTGSSSQKMALYRMATDDEPAADTAAVWTASVDWARLDHRIYIRTERDGESEEKEIPKQTPAEIIASLIASLQEGPHPLLNDAADLDVVGHRVVHGGAEYTAPVVIDDAVQQAIHWGARLAPAHNPVQLEGIKTIERIIPGVPQVAVFDTAFHHTLPKTAAMYPLPHIWFERGIRRYGFHGLSHEYCTERASVLLERRTTDLNLVTCHLGNGCSLAAIQGGMSVDTTMGLTPLEGVMMATRSGSIDPSIPLHLMRDHGLSNDEVEAMLNDESGLKGVSGLSGDMRVIMEAAAEGHSRARLACDMYVHHIRKAIGGMMAVLGRVDALVFTAGVGEHAYRVRARICQGLECMGIQIDPDRNRNARADDDIARADSPTRILIVHTNENGVIARACHRLLLDHDA